MLILGETFRYNGGGGITLINLFKGWDPDKIAVVTERINETSFNTGYVKYYRLGHLELKIPFPFNYINKLQDSGEITVRNQDRKSAPVQYRRTALQSIKFIVEKTYYTIFSFLGFFIANYRIGVSEKLLKWIKDYEPQIIYVQPFSYKDMVFARKIKEATGLPMAIHIMDDSVNFLNKPNLLYLYWGQQIKTAFKQLVEMAEIHLGISEAMSEEYFKRYNKQFMPFRNPIDINTWTPYIKQDWDISGETKIIYTGRLAVPNIKALHIFCKVVDRINNSGFPIQIHIYSNDKNAKFYAQTKKLKSVVFHDAVSFERIPSLISKFDLAVLPIDFTKKGIKYAKYSVSTKTSEYMISGVPIILFAPEEVALTTYARKNNCMYSVSENNMDRLQDALSDLTHDTYLRSSLARKAIEVAKSDSDAFEVRAKFQEVLSSCIIQN